MDYSEILFFVVVTVVTLVTFFWLMNRNHDETTKP